MDISKRFSFFTKWIWTNFSHELSVTKNLPTILESGLSSSVFWIRKISKNSTLIALDLNVLQLSIERKSIMWEAGGACEYMGRGSQISKFELWLMK